MNRKTMWAACLLFLIITLIWLSARGGMDKGLDNNHDKTSSADVSQTSAHNDIKWTENTEKTKSKRSFDSDKAKILDAMGILSESEHGYILNMEVPRIYGIITLVRLAGKEEDAVGYYGDYNEFDDVPDWAAGYVNYVYESGLAESRDETYFGAYESLPVSEYMDMIISLLGYDDYGSVYELAIQLSLITEEKIKIIEDDVFTLGDMIDITYNALSVIIKDEEFTLRDSYNESIATKPIRGKNVLLRAFTAENDKDYTGAIIDANTYLESVGGGTLIFEKGNYLIKPDRIFIPSNVEWLGEDGARLYTKENSIYNVVISTKPYTENISIKNLIFDQMEDDPLVPDSKSYKGCFILHVYNSDNAIVDGCTFYTYGVCAVLSQSFYEYGIENITIINNNAYFQRMIDVFYDVSVFNIDGRNVFVKSNNIISLDDFGMKLWKARTSIEVHMPEGIVENNTLTDSEVGIIHVGWPTLWHIYDPEPDDSVSITNNSIEGSVIGVSCWGPNDIKDIHTMNLNISDNYIGLHLDDKYVPAQGIAIVDGAIGSGIFEGIRITGNEIVFTVDIGIAEYNKIMDNRIPGKDVGAICANTSNRISDMTISGNVVSGFPFAFLNIYKRVIGTETDYHENIKVSDNIISDTCYIRTYGSVNEGLFSIGNTVDIEIYNNTIIKIMKEPLFLLSVYEGVSGLVFKQNDFTSLTDGVEYQYTDFDIFLDQIYDISYLSDIEFLNSSADDYEADETIKGIWIGPRKIMITELTEIISGDKLFTPNNQPVIVTKFDGSYIFTLNEMTEWFDEGDLRKVKKSE